MILEEKNNALREQRRVEFGAGITPDIIRTFCDSSFIDQNNYVETILRLQEIFYLYKNEMMDEITDAELLHFMKEQFETVCFGDPDYLEGTCLQIFSQAIRAGYRGYQATEGYGEYAAFDEVLYCMEARLLLRHYGSQQEALFCYLQDTIQKIPSFRMPENVV